MEEQHRLIAELAVGNQIVVRLEQLKLALLKSLDLEERDLLPAVCEYISVQEWSDLHRHTMSNWTSGL